MGKERQKISRDLTALLLFYFCLPAFLLSCSGEWVSGGEAGLTICELRDALPSAHLPLRAVSRSSGNEIFILDDFASVSLYKRVASSVCAYELQETKNLSGFPSDIGIVSGAGYGADVFLQDGSRIYSLGGRDCYAASGSFAVGSSDLAVAGSGGVRAWNLSGSSCSEKSRVSSFAAAAAAIGNGYYYAVESSGNAPQNLAVYSSAGSLIWREPFSSISGNEKNFCSASRILASGADVYLLDKKCGKLGVFYSNGYWYKTIDLFSLGISAPLDIMQDEYGGALILDEKGLYAVR